MHTTTPNDGLNRPEAARLQGRIDRILNEWARRYAVTPDHHQHCKGLLQEPLYRMLTSLPQGEHPAWMKDLSCREKDSFGYALTAAETAYRTLTETLRHLDEARAEFNRELENKHHEQNDL